MTTCAHIHSCIKLQIRWRSATMIFMEQISADIGLENDVVVSPTVIPYDEFEEYKEKLPYYRNIAREGMQIG